MEDKKLLSFNRVNIHAVKIVDNYQNLTFSDERECLVNLQRWSFRCWRGWRGWRWRHLSASAGSPDPARSCCWSWPWGNRKILNKYFNWRHFLSRKRTKRDINQDFFNFMSNSIVETVCPRSSDPTSNIESNYSIKLSSCDLKLFWTVNK